MQHAHPFTSRALSIRVYVRDMEEGSTLRGVCAISVARG